MHSFSPGISVLSADEYTGSALDLISNTKVYKFNRINDIDKEEIGFIAQDILTNIDGSDNVIGQTIVNPSQAVKNSLQDGEKSYLSYNTGNYTHVIAGALKQAIMKIDKLEKRINDLEELTYQE